MAKLVKVEPNMFEGICSSLLMPMNAHIPAAHWQRLFTPPWPRPEDHVGYALLEGGRFVGFAGYIFADQEIAGVERRTCNISTWTVAPAHRSQAMSLVMPALRRPDLVITNLTSIPTVHNIFQKFGFGELETHIRVHPPALQPITRDAVILKDAQIRDSDLPARIVRVHAAHRQVAHTALVHTSAGACYIIYTIRRRRRMRVAHLHLVSPRELLASALRPLQWFVLRQHGALLVEYDRRLGGTTPRPYFDVSVSDTPRLFRGTGIKPGDISNAYSEHILLNL